MQLQVVSPTGDRIAEVILCRVLGMRFDLLICGHGHANIIGRPTEIKEPGLVIYEGEEVEKIEQARECELFVSNAFRG